MNPTRTLSGLAFVALLTPLCTAAQEAPDPWAFQVELGFNGASGNSSFSVLRTGAKINRNPTDAVEFESSFLIRYGKNEETVIANDAKASMKVNLWPKARWSPFFFVDGIRDRLRKLDMGVNAGVGGKLGVWTGETGNASLSAAVLYDHQNFQVDPGSEDPESESFARWSIRSTLEKTLTANTTFASNLFYQPVWDATSDYVLSMVSSVSTKVLENVSLALEHEYLRDATPPPGVGPDDQKFSVLLTMAF
jgi:hypothetical protein